ncbi:MAG: DMT family transporter [Paracoccaceae bacterium]|nr:DMT family transporter [Paracoccaceae bacterium]
MQNVPNQSDHLRVHYKGLLFVFMAGVLWSTVGLGIRLIQEANVWQILFYRSISLSIFLFFVIFIRSRENPLKLVVRAGAPAVVAGLSLMAAYSGGIYAIQSTSVANAMLLFASAPFFAAVLGSYVLKERVSAVTWVSIGIALFGITVMVSDLTGGPEWSGSLAALGSAIGFSIFTVSLRWGKSNDMLPAVFLSGLFSIIITATICINLALPLVLSVNDISISFGMGVFQVGAGLVFYTLGSKTLPAAELTLLSLAEVLLGPFWVWLFLGEMASSATALGGAILLFAIVGNAVYGTRKKREKPRARISL